MSAARPPRLVLRLEFDGGRLGPGKIELLERVRELGSLAAAARAMGMSYRRAWQLLAQLNTMFDTAVATTHPGRRRGASTELTALGARVIALYRALERQAAAADALKELLGALAPARPPRRTGTAAPAASAAVRAAGTTRATRLPVATRGRQPAPGGASAAAPTPSRRRR